jgi:hypothetical protein
MSENVSVGAGQSVFPSTGVSNAVDISAILWTGTFDMLLDHSSRDRAAYKFVYKSGALRCQAVNSPIPIFIPARNLIVSNITILKTSVSPFINPHGLGVWGKAGRIRRIASRCERLSMGLRSTVSQP